MRKVADGPLSYAKSGYWLGRVYEAQGRMADAQAQYKAAARYADTFHGQLARRKLLGEAALMTLEPPAAPTADEIARFGRLDSARAAVIARKAGLERSIYRGFLIQLQRSAGSEANAVNVNFFGVRRSIAVVKAASGVVVPSASRKR